MDLLSLAQLQAVLDVTQEDVGIGKVLKVAAGDVPLVVQLLQGKQRAAGAEPGLRASVNPLQALHEEFNVANASAIESDVEAVGMRAECAEGTGTLADPLASLKRGADGGKIDTSGVHIGFDAVNKGTGQVRVAGRVTNFDQRLPLPVVGVTGVVPESMREADRQFSLAALRTKAHVDAEHGAFTGGTGEHVG